MSRIVQHRTPVCPICGRRGLIEVPEEGLKAWQQGELIQKALPLLDEDQRELLITGTHAHCWRWMSDEDD